MKTDTGTVIVETSMDKLERAKQVFGLK